MAARTTSCLCLTIFCVAGLLQVPADAQITNGSFESGNFSGWTVTNPAGSSVYVSTTQGRTDGTYAAAWNGSNQLGSSSLAQSFSSTLGQRYLLQFDYGVFAAKTQQMNATVQGGATLLNQTVTATGPSGANDTSFTRYYLPFVADSVSTTLTLTDNTTLAQSANADGNLDNVAVTAVSPGTVSPGGAGTVGTVHFVSGNVALAGTATQHSTSSGGVPARAIDGNTNGNWGAGSTTHTSSSAAAWWQVDLGGEYAIQNVTIFNRSDCCQDRLVQFSVDLLNSATSADVLSPFDLGTPGGGNNDGVADSGGVQTNPPFGLRVEYAPNTVGKVVRVEQNAVLPLSLAEVQAFGLANYLQPTGDVLEIDILGVGNHDFVNVEGNATLAGSLDISLGFTPGMGDVFDLMTAGGTIDISGLTLIGDQPSSAVWLARVVDLSGGGQLFQLAAVPEPSTLAMLLGLCGLGLIGYLRRRRRS